MARGGKGGARRRRGIGAASERAAERRRLDRIVECAASAYGFTAAQRRIARLLLQGRSLKQIAQDLHLHRRTVSDHVRELRRKTGSRCCASVAVRICEAQSRPEIRSRCLDACVLRFAQGHGLTTFQASIVGMVLHGHTAREIARLARRTPRAVRRHLDVVRRKAGLTTRLEIAIAAVDPWLGARDVRE